MLGAGTARFLEVTGIRGLYVFVTQTAKQVPLPPVGQLGSFQKWTKEDQETTISHARYFGTSNFLRCVLNGPFLVMFATHDAWWQFWFYVVQNVLHALLVLVEIYKVSLAKLVTPVEAGEKEPEDVPSRPFADWYFRPKGWETERFYQLIGVGSVRKLLLMYTSWALLSKEQRRTGEKPEYVTRPSANQILRFDNESRIAECCHGVLALFDVVPLVFAIQHHLWWWMPYILWAVWGDSWLVMLQRLHRVRLWRSVLKARRKVGWEVDPVEA